MFCCFGSCSRRPDFQNSISLRLALPNHFHAGSLIKFPFSCKCGEAIISLVIWYQRQLLHVLKSVTYHIFRSENFQQNLNCRYRVILPFSVIYPYQIQHCFECIFTLFFKTVFNLFCEIGFKYGEKCIFNVFFDCF